MPQHQPRTASFTTGASMGSPVGGGGVLLSALRSLVGPSSQQQQHVANNRRLDRGHTHHREGMGRAAGVDGPEGGDGYDALLQLGQDNGGDVPRGINRQTQREVLRPCVYRKQPRTPARTPTPPTAASARTAVPSTPSRPGKRAPALSAASTTAAPSSPEEPSETCVVCQEEFKDGEAIVGLAVCPHRFHRPCIEPWLERERQCPTCRKEVYPRATA